MVITLLEEDADLIFSLIENSADKELKPLVYTINHQGGYKEREQ